MKDTFFRLFVLLCVSGVSSALYCYQCDSRSDTACKEYLDESDRTVLRPTLCTTNAAEYCVKTTGVWGGAVGTTRFCSSRDMFNQCQYVKYADHDRIYRACIYTCTRDGCNSAQPTTLSWTLVSVLSALVFAFNVRALAAY